MIFNLEYFQSYLHAKFPTLNLLGWFPSRKQYPIKLRGALFVLLIPKTLPSYCIYLPKSNSFTFRFIHFIIHSRSTVPFASPYYLIIFLHLLHVPLISSLCILSMLCVPGSLYAICSPHHNGHGLTKWRMRSHACCNAPQIVGFFLFSESTSSCLSLQILSSFNLFSCLLFSHFWVFNRSPWIRSCSSFGVQLIQFRFLVQNGIDLVFRLVGWFIRYTRQRNLGCMVGKKLKYISYFQKPCTEP